MLSPAPFCFFHALYSISFVQLAAVFQPLLLLSPSIPEKSRADKKDVPLLVLPPEIWYTYNPNFIMLSTKSDSAKEYHGTFQHPFEDQGDLLPHRAVFGPMAGFTDAPARRLMAQHGAGFTVSEMVSSRALVYGDHKTVSLLKAEPTVPPTACRSLARCPRSWARPLPPWNSTRSIFWTSTWAVRPPRSSRAGQAAS